MCRIVLICLICAAVLLAGGSARPVQPLKQLPPELMNPGDLEVQEGYPVSFQIRATDRNSDPLAYSFSPPIPGAILHPATGLFTQYSRDADLRVGSLAFAPDGSLWAVTWPDRRQVVRFTDRARVMSVAVGRALGQLARQGQRFDGALIDPPYGLGQVAPTLRALHDHGLIRPGGWVIVEHDPKEQPEVLPGTELTLQRQYGKTGLALILVSDTMPQTNPSETRAVYAGSFDPITNGHLDVLRRALEVFPNVIIAVAGNTSDPKKSGALFTADERVQLIRASLGAHAARATATTFRGLLVDYCDTVGARVIIRGLRAVSDFEYEFQMAMMNRHLKPHIETVFMTASEENFYTSSRLVKEVVALGGDVGGLVPDPVCKQLVARLRPGT